MMDYMILIGIVIIIILVIIAIVKNVNEGVRVFSIVERLELAKEQLSSEKSEEKSSKDTVKKPEMGME